MEILELGTFILLNIFAFGLLAFCTMTRVDLARYLLILPMMFFFVLSFYMVAEYEVGSTVRSVGSELHYSGNGTLLLNVTKPGTSEIFISDFDTNWLTWVYLVLGMFCMLLIIYSWRKA